MRLHLEHCIQMWSPQYRRNVDLLECIQGRATEMIQGMELLSYEGRLRELGLLSMEKRRLWGNLRAAFPKGGYKKEGDRLISRICFVRTRENGFKLKEGRLKLGRNFYKVSKKVLQ